MSEFPDDPVAAVAIAIAQVRDMFAPVREATSGYRTSLLSEGISPGAADMMTADFHHMLTALVVKGIQGNQT